MGRRAGGGAKAPPPDVTRPSPKGNQVKIPGPRPRRHAATLREPRDGHGGPERSSLFFLTAPTALESDCPEIGWEVRQSTSSRDVFGAPPAPLENRGEGRAWAGPFLRDRVAPKTVGERKLELEIGSAYVSKEDWVNIPKPDTSRWPQGSELGDAGRRPGGSSLLSLTVLVPGMILHRDREGLLVEYLTMWGIPCASDGPGKSKGESLRPDGNRPLACIGARRLDCKADRPSRDESRAK
jgi:hypothetical protein